MSYGVRKVNEFIVRDGRALIMTQNVASSITKDQWDSIANGTLYINPSTGDFRYKKAGSEPRVWDNLTPDNLFLSESIGGNLMALKAITEPKLADNAISTRTIIDRNVTSSKIQLKGILTEHFADNSLNGKVVANETLHGDKLIVNSTNGSKVQDRTLKGIKLVQNTITDYELNTDSVTTIKIKNLNVTTDKLANNSVTTIKVVDLNITTEKLANLGVTYEKLAKSSIDWDNLKNDSVRTSAIKDLNITTAKIANLSIINEKIASQAITNDKMASKTLTNASIANGTITLSLLEQSLQTTMNNAVVHSDGVARVYGDLQVDKNIKSTSNNKTYSITGFKVYNPVFADYAEGFVVSEPVTVGDIVEIDKHGCVKKASSHSMKIVGVVSDRYGLCLDADEEELSSGAKTAVGLLGKVPVNVVGRIEAGDFIISSGDGIGIATKKYKPGAIVGKALEDKETYGLGQVLCLINPM